MVRDGGGAPPEGWGEELSLAGYTELTQIGRGGSSVVFRAWQPSFNRWVAIKVIAIGTDAPLSRFTRERLAAGTLSGHPNVVNVYDAGVTADRRAYIVMEYLPDGTVADELGHAPLRWPDVAVVGVKLGGALETAHRAGVLHLDVKPENVFLARDYDSVKLGDFGIARIEGTAETWRGTISGTLLHMAPERLEGDRPTAASDVYSLASTLYTLVCGHPPFGRAGEPAGVVIGRTLNEPPPLDELHHRGVPSSFCRIIEQGLSKDPSHRQSGAGELGEQLRTVQAEAGLAPTPMAVRDGPADDRPLVPPPTAPAPGGDDTIPPAPTPSGTGDSPEQARPEKPAHRRRAFLTAVAVVLVAAAAVAAALGRGRSGPPATEGDRPDTTLAALPPDQPGAVFQDDFSNRSTGWTYHRDMAYYDTDSTYRLRVPGTKTGLIGKPRQGGDPILTALTDQQASVRVEVDASFLSDVRTPKQGAAGLICRMQPDKERYQGLIFPNGHWEITRQKPELPVVILASGAVTLPLGPHGYRIRFECGGDGRPSTLRLHVGETFVGEGTDANGLNRGEVGVIAASVNAPSVDVRFDNFVATRLP